jgi:hypothetical protein
MVIVRANLRWRRVEDLGMANDGVEDIIEERETPKKVYRSPRLHCYGTLRELTLMLGKGNRDGGTMKHHQKTHSG